MSAHRQPRNWDELQTAIRTNMTKHGPVAMGLPCFFCGAPEWLVFDLNPASPHSAERMLAAGARCKACNRSARSIMLREPGGGRRRLEIVQTAGVDPPAWFLQSFPMRRIL
jgi:hypothetical protein